MSAADLGQSSRLQAEDMFDKSYYHSAGLRTGAVPGSRSTGFRVRRDSESVQAIAVPAQYPANHTLDVAAYVAERFPSELQEFVKAQKAPLYVDDSSCGDSVRVSTAARYYTRQRRSFMGDRDGPDSQYLFVFKP